MGKLSASEVKELLEKRPNRKLLDAAIRHENRLAFHADMVVHKELLSPYYGELIAWLGIREPELLPADKVSRFKQLCTAPIATVSITDSIFKYFHRIFFGQDAFYRIDFDNPDTIDDWHEFRDRDFWEVNGFAAMKSAINSVWVAEIPTDQAGELPEPKNRLIDIRNVIDIQHENSGRNIRHCIFENSDILFSYDTIAIQAWDYKDKNIGIQLADIEHGLGYTPARMFWSDCLRDPINKRAPLTPVLGDLDWLLIHKTFKKYMDMANAYPIIAAYEQSDDFENSRRDDDNGRDHEGKANSNYNMGPGSFWGVRPPLQGEPDLMSNPLKLISPDVTTLDFHVREENRLTEMIQKKVVGVDSEATTMAQNEKQVLSGFETQTNVLRSIAANFEVIQSFADTTIFTLRYGRPVDISVDYGSRFFLRNVTDLVEDLSDAKDKGAHDSIVEMLSTELIETKFRNDKRGFERAMLLRALDPLPDKGVKDAIEIYKEGGIDKTTFIIKCNYLSFINRFEREQAPLIVYGANLDLSARIKLIKEELTNYAKEFSSEQRPDDSNQGM